MRRHFAFPGLVLAFLPILASAQTADELVAKNLAARGGAEKLAAIKTLRLSGKLSVGDVTLALVNTFSRTGGYRSEYSLQGFTGVDAYDGKEAWSIKPFEGRKDPERQAADETRALADTALIAGPLLSAAADGSKVQALGTEDVDGGKTWKLRVTQADGDEFTYYLDADTYLEVRMVEKRRLRGSETEFENELGDYEAVDGVMFPMSVDTRQRGSTTWQRVTIDKAEANLPVDEAFFHMPGGK